MWDSMPRVVQRFALALHYDVGLLPRLLQFVRTHELICPGDRVGVAVSGGADSTALLRALLELRSELGCVLSVIHLHHGLRGVEADADAAFVQQLAEAHGLPMHFERADVAAYAREKKLSLEAAGRRARIRYFAALQRQGALDKVATAHTADDQAETVLLKLLRGAGTRGLAGIFPAAEQAGTFLVRPLLGNTRAEVEHYLKALQQSWREDSSNRSPEFLRNRVRHELLPLLERDYNPAIRESLNITAEIAREEQNFWDVIIGNLLRDLQAENGMLDAISFRALHVALQRRALKALAPAALDFEHIERAREFIVAAQAGQRQIARGLELRLIRESSGAQWFAFADELGSGSPYSLGLALPGEVQLPSPRNSRLVARLSPSATFGTALDPVLAGRVLTVRNWRPGDRFHPIGRGDAKFKDFFQQLKVPAAARATWPVVELEGEIVWVLGLPVAAKFAAAGNSGFVIEELPSQNATR